MFDEPVSEYGKVHFLLSRVLRKKKLRQRELAKLMARNGSGSLSS